MNPTPTISEAALEAAVRTAVDVGLIPRMVFLDQGATIREQLAKVVGSALDSARPAPKEGETPMTDAVGINHATASEETYKFRKLARSLELRLAEKTRELEALKKRILDDNKAYGCELRDPSGTIWEYADSLRTRCAELEEDIEEMDRIHDDIMTNGPRCTCGEGDEWCGRCAKSSKLSYIAHKARTKETTHEA